MKVLIDTDVLLDVALNRDPHVAASADVLRWAERGGEAAVAWHSLANCAYLLKGEGRGFLERLLQVVEVATVGTADAKRAMQLRLSDLEDAFQVASGLAYEADYIISRNLSDYRNSPVPVISPSEFLQNLK